MVKVLLIEDQPTLRRLVAEVLEFSGYHVVALGDANTALDMLRSAEFVPDLILSDLVLEAMSGTDLLDAVRSEWLWRDIAFIAMSGKEQIEALDSKQMREVDGYIAKPFGIKEVLTTVQHALAQRQRHNSERQDDTGDSQRFA